MADLGAPGDEAVRDQHRQAHQALADAAGARDAGLSDAVVVNRLYYAVFHTAQAVLYARGYETRSHGGVLSKFGSDVVVPGDASREHGRFLNLLSELRKQADYGYGSIDEDIDELLEQSREFVAEVEALTDDSP